jgi:hypothetical protein
MLKWDIVKVEEDGSIAINFLSLQRDELGKDYENKVKAGKRSAEQRSNRPPPPVPTPLTYPESESELESEDIYTKHKYGEYKHVLLTDSQHSKLLSDLGDKGLAAAIKRVDEYVQQTGKHYKDYNLTIRNWLARDREKSQPKEPRYTSL